MSWCYWRVVAFDCQYHVSFRLYGYWSSTITVMRFLNQLVVIWHTESVQGRFHFAVSRLLLFCMRIIWFVYCFISLLWIYSFTLLTTVAAWYCHLGLVWKKLNLRVTQQKYAFTNHKKCTITQKLKPGLVAFYDVDIRSGNGAGLFSKENITKGGDSKEKGISGEAI